MSPNHDGHGDALIKNLLLSLCEEVLVAATAIFLEDLVQVQIQYSIVQYELI